MFADMANLPNECAQLVLSFLPLLDCLQFGATSLSGLQTVIQNVSARRNRLKVDSYNQVNYTTVQARVALLSLEIPRRHRLAPLVLELERSLNQDLTNELSSLRHTSSLVLVVLFQRVVRELKLHSIVLHRALFEHEARTSLEQYVGDVLCVTYLLSSNATHTSYAESSLSFDSLQGKLKSQPSCPYTLWVLLHSSLLRTKVFPNSPDLPRQTGTGTVNLPWNLSMECFRSDSFLESTMTLVYNDFAPLGPTFRGRDIVRIRDISAQSMLDFVASSFTDQRHVALLWLRLVHEQAFKSRPMTVREPEIRLL